MSASLTIMRAAPLTTIQDDGRFGMLRHGISASGPMDRGAFKLAGTAFSGPAGGVEFTRAGLELTVSSGTCCIGFAGGDFAVRLNGAVLDWPGRVAVKAGDILAITPGAWGNYGYLRFDGDLELGPVLGSVSTNSRARLGGLAGRTLEAGDVLRLTGAARAARDMPIPRPGTDGPIRVIWGLHADLFSADIRERFVSGGFAVSNQLDRMGVRLTDPQAVFADATILSLVSDAVVAGDIQILGDGTPIVLMRDHQPTGGYPRIATIISADLDRFAQLRPGSPIAFEPVSVEHAHRLLRSA